MAYTKNPTWQDGVAGGTLITAAALNHIEDGLLDAAADADAASGAVTPDATASVKGKVQLAGDLAGTAAAPTVPALAGKAATVHTHTSTDVTDFAETVDDRVAALIKAGANVTTTYDDTAGTLTIASTASGGGSATTVGPGPAFWVGHNIGLIQPNAPQRAVDPTKGGNRPGGLPVGISRTVTASSASIRVNVGAASGSARVGIYRTDADGQPTTTLWDSGAIDCTNAGQKTVTGAITIPAGNYWILTTTNNSAIRFDGWYYSPYLASTTTPFDTNFIGAVFGSATVGPANPLPDLTAVAVGNDNTATGGAAILQLNVTGLS